MSRAFTERLARILVEGAVLAALMMTSGGCQTFSMSHDDFRKQQEGKMADRETGEVVSTVGTAGYFGAVIGSAIAALVGK